MTRTLPARRLAAAAAALALLGAVSACSGGSGDSSSADVGGTRSEVAGSAVGRAPTPAKAAGGAAADSAGSAAEVAADLDATVAEAPDPTGAEARSLIRTGNVALRSDDVDATIFDVRQVLQQTRGEVADESTTADDEGDAETALMTLRVPVEEFDTALEALKALGDDGTGVELVDAGATTEDVSTQVIDTDVRVELQKRSIERISVLLDRASSIRDIVSIERELARREADLGSLQKRQDFLADQTSMSTISVSVERPREVKEQVVQEEERNSFVTGLSNGWDAFGDATRGLLTAVGALLPFAILALLVGVPVRLWLRRRRPTVVATEAS